MIVSSDGFVMSSKPPSDVWFLDGTTDSMKHMCLDTVLRLGGVSVSIRPQDKWTRSMSLLAPDAMIPWSQTMPSIEYKSFVKNLIKSLTETIDNIPKDYYRNTWYPGGRLLHSLKAAKVDHAAYKNIVTDMSRDSGAFATFRPGHGGFLSPVVYDRFATRTGRLTVASGPNILTLKKQYRKILKSTFQDGTICSLDFAALEARIILAEANKTFSTFDLYGTLATELFGEGMNREAVKIAVISELYGASRAMLASRLGISGRKLEEFVTKIRTYFGTPELRKRLKDEFVKTGKIQNKHGRLLDIDDPQDHLFVNTYAQSTGVDVSLLGFKSIVDTLGIDGVRPLFVLHDALILDVREDRLSDVEAIKSVAVSGYTMNFPLRFEKL